MDTTATATASAVRQAAHRLVRRLNATADRSGLTAAQRGMLAGLDVAGELTSADLARAEMVSPQAANVAVADLVARGLVVRRNDPSDGRRRLLALTGEGRAAIHAVRDDKEAWLAQRITDELDDEERTVLLRAAGLVQRLLS